MHHNTVNYKTSNRQKEQKLLLTIKHTTMYDVQIKTAKNWVFNYQIKKVGKFPNPKEIEKLKHNYNFLLYLDLSKARISKNRGFKNS